jgi:hypothetical protein
VITKDLYTYTIIILRQDKSLRDQWPCGGVSRYRSAS